MAWTLHSEVTEADWNALETFMNKAGQVIEPAQFWAAIEARKTDKPADQVLADEEQEAKEQELTPPSEMTWEFLNEHLGGLVTWEGWNPKDFISAVEDAYPQVIKST